MRVKTTWILAAAGLYAAAIAVPLTGLYESAYADSDSWLALAGFVCTCLAIGVKLSAPWRVGLPVVAGIAIMISASSSDNPMVMITAIFVMVAGVLLTGIARLVVWSVGRSAGSGPILAAGPIILFLAATAPFAVSGAESAHLAISPRLSPTLARQLPLNTTYDLGNLCDGSAPARQHAVLMSRGWALVNALRLHAGSTVAVTYYSEDSGNYDERMTVRQFARTQLRFFGRCEPGLRRAIEDGIN